ncbi:MAG: dihydropyrimidinase [Chloroflexi bacterium]|nr:dihydropyrimidinase [Chloroflexota bacterium]
MYDLVIQNGTLVSNTAVWQADIGILGEKIAEIAPHLEGRERISAKGMLVLPGGVDPHVHLEMPTPTTTTSETWATGTQAAAFGGTTTVIDFVEPGYPRQPLLEAFRERLSVAQAGSSVDFGLHMTLCTADEDTLAQVRGVVAAGLPSFKLYTTYAGFRLDDEELLAAFEAIQKAGALAMVHAESDVILRQAALELQAAGRLSLRDFPQSRPAIAEKEAVERVLSLAAFAGCPLYIVHVSTRTGASAIARARQDGQAAWGETCPQYLLLDESRIRTSDFSGAKFVCCPPLRTPADREALWDALHAGDLQTLGTDHCAFNFRGQKELGRDSFLEVPSGLPGIELRLALLYTFGVKTGKITLSQWVDLCSTAPARLFGLHPRKGELIPGADADVVLFHPDRSVPVTHAMLHENVDYTPYEGLRLAGGVHTTLLRGQVLVREGEWVGHPCTGGFVPCSSFHPG